MKYQIIIIRDFSHMTVWGIYYEKDNGFVWGKANDLYQHIKQTKGVEIDYDVLGFNNIGELNMFLQDEFVDSV